MIQPDWKRIAGLEVVDDGTIAVAWIAHDRTADVIHLYDCCIFRREVLAIIAEGLNNHGRWIPIAWEKSAKPMAEKLRERGCNLTYDPHEDNDAVAEAVARDIWGRMRSGRFRVQKGLAEWLDEFKTFNRTDQKVPRETHPLMTATRFAVAMHDEWAKPERHAGYRKINHPNVAVV